MQKAVTYSDVSVSKDGDVFLILFWYGGSHVTVRVTADAAVELATDVIIRIRDAFRSKK